MSTTEPRTTYALALDVLVHVGTHVRHARCDRDLTQDQLARRLGLSRHALARVEGGGVVRSSTLEVVLTWLDHVARREPVVKATSGRR